MKRTEVDVLGEQTNAWVIKLPVRHFPGMVLQGDSLHVLHELAAKVSAALAEGRSHDAEEKAAELYEKLEGYVGAYEAALAREGMALPYLKKRSADRPRDERADPEPCLPRETGRPATLEPHEQADRNLAQIRVQLPTGQMVSGGGYRVELALSRDAMVGLATALLRLAHQDPDKWIFRHLRPIEPGLASQSLGLYLVPESCELLFAEDDLGTVEAHMRAVDARARQHGQEP